MGSYPSIHLALYRLGLIAVLMAGLSACQSTGTLAPGPPIAPERRIALQPSGPHRGAADTGELVVAYTYQLMPDPAREIYLKGGLRQAKYRGDSLNIYVNFLDNTGRVLQKKVLFASGYKRDNLSPRPAVFDTTLPLPPGTVAIAFSSYVKASAGRR